MCKGSPTIQHSASSIHSMHWGSLRACKQCTRNTYTGIWTLALTSTISLRKAFHYVYVSLVYIESFLPPLAGSMLCGFHSEGKFYCSCSYVHVCLFPLPCSQHEFNAVHFLLLKPKQSMVLQIPARLQVCPHGLVVHMTDKMKVFELMASIKEIYHISDIREVCSLYLACPLTVNIFSTASWPGL